MLAVPLCYYCILYAQVPLSLRLVKQYLKSRPDVFFYLNPGIENKSTITSNTLNKSSYLE